MSDLAAVYADAREIFNREPCERSLAIGASRLMRGGLPREDAHGWVVAMISDHGIALDDHAAVRILDKADEIVERLQGAQS